MQSLHTARVFNAEPETIFDVIADHAGYASLPGVRRAYLRAAGQTERDGVGAERVLCLPGLTFVERITKYDYGRALGYRIVESPLPIAHLGARVLLEPLPSASGGTRVHWTSRLRATTGFARSAVEIAIAGQMALAYAAALKLWARRLDDSRAVIASPPDRSPGRPGSG